MNEDTDREQALVPETEEASPRDGRRRKPPEPIEALFKPSFTIFAGRGNMGKTTGARWVCGRASRPVLVYDGDANRLGLSRFVEGAYTPASADEVDVLKGLEDVINRHIVERIDVVVDLAGGDRVFPTMARLLDLQSFLEASGSRPVIFYLAGPDLADLSLMAELEADGLFAPACTGVLFNEHLIPRWMPDRSFKAVIEQHEDLRRALMRGAVVARIPRLETADIIGKAGVQFRDAAEGRSLVDGRPLSPVQRQQTRRWLQRMEEAMEPMLGWLP